MINKLFAVATILFVPAFAAAQSTNTKVVLPKYFEPIPLLTPPIDRATVASP
jgi:hypothetical protein